MPSADTLPIAGDRLSEVALVEDQVNIALLPCATVVGPAVSWTVGATAAAVTDTVADCVTEPPDPVQVSS